MSQYVPSSGDLVYFNFNSQSGHEQVGKRPTIVLSPKEFNSKTGFAWVCPIASQKKEYPFEVELPDQTIIYGVILIDQLKSLDWQAGDIEYKERVPDDVVEKCLARVHTILF
ncbi:MAG: type II toxin-antitoxin system PemK/MazF family toxin [Sporolactobacillus sp.]